MASNIVQEAKLAEKKRWVMIYPCYINSRKKISEGRKIGKSASVEQPNCQEIANAAKSLGYVVEIEHKKQHPRGWNERGRVLIQFFDKEHKPLISKVSNRNTLYKEVSKLISRMNNRQIGSFDTNNSNSGTGGSGSGSNKKKKGKKGRR